MNISPDEAQQALDAIQEIARKTRRALSSSGAYLFLIVWGAIWLVGFLGNQFLSPRSIGYLWFGLDVIGALLSWFIVARMKRYIRNAGGVPGRRLAWFWALLFLYVIALIGVTWPLDVRQVSAVIVLVVMLGQLAMGVLLTITSVPLTLSITALTLVAYFIFPAYFHFIMAFLGGGGMIAAGFYIRNRW
ncbi:MAG: hypothetical protein N2049_08975 [Anaerolineales bacterium]|nr:hypothetical protein [Anaerolineales bacterium]